MFPKDIVEQSYNEKSNNLFVWIYTPFLALLTLASAMAILSAILPIYFHCAHENSLAMSQLLDFGINQHSPIQRRNDFMNRSDTSTSRPQKCLYLTEQKTGAIPTPYACTAPNARALTNPNKNGNLRRFRKMCSRFAQFQRQTRILFLFFSFRFIFPPCVLWVAHSISPRACRLPLSYAYLCLGPSKMHRCKGILLVVVVVVVTVGQERKQRKRQHKETISILRSTADFVYNKQVSSRPQKQDTHTRTHALKDITPQLFSIGSNTNKLH